MTERNQLNVYNHLEAIRKAADALETIHVYEVNARQHGDADTPSLKAQVADLEKQVLEYELQINELDTYVQQLELNNKILLEANNKLIQANSDIKNAIEDSQNEAEKIIAAYNKLPRVVKKFYGVN